MVEELQRWGSPTTCSRSSGRIWTAWPRWWRGWRSIAVIRPARDLNRDGRVDLVTRLVPVAFASLLAVIRDPAGAPTLLEGTVNSRVRLQVRD